MSTLDGAYILCVRVLRCLRRTGARAVITRTYNPPMKWPARVVDGQAEHWPSPYIVTAVQLEMIDIRRALVRVRCISREHQGKTEPIRVANLQEPVLFRQLVLASVAAAIAAVGDAERRVATFAPPSAANAVV